MIILGIETSCDETAAAVIEGRNNNIKVLSNIVSSQINIHQKYGGVVPEVAAREHVLQILPVINEALEQAGIKREDARKKINTIAVATGPGLITSLLVGVETAKVLSYVWQVPVVSINHIEGHIYANFVSEIFNSQFSISKLFPTIILTVSGGHTMLVLMKGHGKFRTIGETRDDAAGEAFDKAAKLLSLGYPGGPEIAKCAEKYIKQNSKISNPQFPISKQILNFKFQISKHKSQVILPRPMINSRSYDFSFSGLKTALLYELKKDPRWKKKVPQYAYEFQQAIIDVLISKSIKAAKEYKVKTVMLTGGVAANQELRKQMENNIKEKLPNTQYLTPNIQYTTDNAVMVAVAGYYKALRKDFTLWHKLKVDCNLEWLCCTNNFLDGFNL